MNAPEKECCCRSLDDLAIVPMGGDGLDEQVFASLDRVCDYGGDLWWLYLSRCSACGQNWAVAQEERIHDNYCLKRLGPVEARAAIEQNLWPEEFLTFEDVLKLERASGKIALFFDRLSPALADTAKELREARPEITIEEIADVLAIEPATVRLFLS